MLTAFQDLAIINNAWSLLMAHSLFAVVAFVGIFIGFMLIFKYGFKRMNYGFALLAVFIAIFITALLINGFYGAEAQITCIFMQ